MKKERFEAGGTIGKPEDSARSAGLRHVNDSGPGMRRRKSGNGFRYLDCSGKPLRDPAHLARIRSLAIPPAWTDAWICPLPNGHLQATGRDARRRKQHRYHPRWREARDENKFNRMMLFARKLPAIRKRARKDVSLAGLPRRKVLATVVRLLELSLIRVGNDEYARQNGSYGLTTLRDRHAGIHGATIRFEFRGKLGRFHSISVRDKRLARVVKHCQDLPGQELFQYLDEHGQACDVTSEDVNAYLREISGHDFTAKDFRTWAGTVLAAIALREFKEFDNQTQAKKNIVQAIESVAKRLGNTPAICRKCYVHPEILSAYMEGSMKEVLRHRAGGQLRRNLDRLPPQEAAVAALLRARLARSRTPLESLLKQSLRQSRRPNRRK